MDPQDWEAFRADMHRLLDQCVDQLHSARERPWQPVPDAFNEAITIPDQTTGEHGAVMDRLAQDILPQTTGNTHPAFFGWVHGTGQAMGLASELVAATMNSNCGGRDHGAIRVEQEVIRWLCATAGWPANTGGILTTGTSQATIYALCAARLKRFGAAVRTRGLHDMPRLRVYAAKGAHSCVVKALQVMGHGTQALKQIPLRDGQMDLDALREALRQDRDAGIEPLAIVATAGSVNTGTFDDIAGLARIAHSHGTWLHVDAAFGYWIRLADAPWRALADGMEEADSIALDGHKWLGVTYDCGACLIRDQAVHRATFAERPEYLAAQSKGLAAGDWWPTDYGTELSRGFRALKMWTALQTHGPEVIGAVVTDNCKQAALMGALAEASDLLDLACPVVSNLCVIRPRQGDPAALAAQLQLSGEAVFSTTTLDGAPCLRAAIVNHRTTSDTIRAAVTALERAVATAPEGGALPAGPA
ncbi:aminotransferase class V-fold PLP-dependent enzyme [Aliishimia ponticola]|uniref:Aminotransferase class V-fold PLP-dependent enzyme n=2 Tax=Aliishimia ponticola TaxID=2499833 RepID=A0A4S4NH49_9RHOB|nr:aminotransferase class V-fold PLP-dependent enzyme [Aliishimia ponticola]